MHQDYNKVCVVGLGYIGLPTASLLATKGFNVYGVDTSAEVVEKINRGEVHIAEPDLDVLVKSAVQSGRLTAGTRSAPADVFIIAVPTPFKNDHVADLSYVDAAIEDIASNIQKGNLIVLESTCPVGTTESIADQLCKLRPDLNVSNRCSTASNNSEEVDVYIAHCPERVLPGQILKELVDNDRTIGGINQISTKEAIKFYQKFVNGNVLSTDSRTAELSKLVENSYRDVNIAFANELSMICDKLDISVWDLIDLANRHPRVNILQPGPGVGGHCIAVDPWFIVNSVPDNARLIRTAREVNDSKPGYVLAKIREHSKQYKQPKIACLGIAFKANVDDLRESPALDIVHNLSQSSDTKVLVVEPNIDKLPALLSSGNVELCDIESAISRADIVVLLVSHDEFVDLNRNLLGNKTVIDTRGVWR